MRISHEPPEQTRGWQSGPARCVELGVGRVSSHTGDIQQKQTRAEPTAAETFPGTGRCRRPRTGMPTPSTQPAETTPEHLWKP